MKNIDFRNGQQLIMMVSQYDYGYNLQVALWTNGEPVTITAAEIVSENFTTACTVSGNVVTIPVTTSMTERFGHFPAELRVTDSTGQVSSKNFDWFVERSPLAVKSSETYSGDIVEFTAKRVPLNSVVVTMEPIQSGSGDPSPTNVRPITGRTGASVLVNSEYSETGATTYPITFTSAGTVYAGTVDLVSGVLTVTHGSITIDGSMSIRLEGTRFYVGKDDCKRLPLYTTDSIRCDRLPTVADETQIKFNSAGITAYKQSSSYVGRNWIYFSSGDESITTTAQMQSWLADNPLQVVYELADPITYNLTPVQVMSLLGENVVWSPDGEVTVVVPEFYS